jgi:hypothetical protein
MLSRPLCFRHFWHAAIGGYKRIVLCDKYWEAKDITSYLWVRRIQLKAEPKQWAAWSGAAWGFSHRMLYCTVSVRSYGRVSYTVTDVNYLSFVNISAVQQQIFIVLEGAGQCSRICIVGTNIRTKSYKTFMKFRRRFAAFQFLRSQQCIH